uniref:hypothetical protein n=1 Tax=Pelomonas sp. KK5 TaxID=1855730 RepID=UPI001301EFD9
LLPLPEGVVQLTRERLGTELAARLDAELARQAAAGAEMRFAARRDALASSAAPAAAAAPLRLLHDGRPAGQLDLAANPELRRQLEAAAKER